MAARVYMGGQYSRLHYATATGAGSALALETVMSKFTVQTVITGAPTTVSITLDGSLDGVNWTVLATSASTTGDQQTVVDKPQKYLRANVATFTGGTSPTATVYLAALP